MAVTFNDVNSEVGLKKLDKYLLSRSFITGYQASKDDIAVYVILSKAPSTEYVNAATDEDDEDDVDLFGEETEEEKKAAEERAASIKSSGKKKESGKSSVLLDVKPWDDETDMKKLEEAVRSV